MLVNIMNHTMKIVMMLLFKAFPYEFQIHSNVVCDIIKKIIRGQL
jgi:hypothetical protein